MAAGYYHTPESVSEYIQLAKDVDGRRLIAKLKKILPSGSTVLELGSGPGTDWEILNTEFNVVGSDNSQVFLDHLTKTYPAGMFKPVDAVTIAIEEKFDAIYSNKVLHHLTDVELVESVRRQAEVLNHNGIVCHSFWLGEGSEVFKGLFVNYHSEPSLRKLFSTHFDILLIEPYAEFEENDSAVLIARKK